MDFKGDKNRQLTSLRMGRKAGGAMEDFTVCYRTLEVFQILMGKILTPSFIPPTFPDVSAGRTARGLWWTSQKLSPVGFITMPLHAHISPG
jgi:hypothetical protein